MKIIVVSKNVYFSEKKQTTITKMIELVISIL